ncbi:phage integrase SAM-like domain-containing protein [Flavobacterium sp. DSR2-3-3]|uniref:phage integrase SAM-like domain-containing protein n=1 Tax=Flavobacterium sp. DSR2-3-3 TaxID=2804632 RepID=UPI003CF29E9B
MDKHNAFFEKKVTAGKRSKASFQKYGRSKELLVNFMKQQYGVEDLHSNEISSAFVYNLESYLKYESSFKGRIGIKNNSMVKYMRMYKTACNYCIRMGLMEKNPFNLYDGKLSIKDAVFLTHEELDRIENKKFSVKRLERVKDVFLFSC